MKTKEKEFCCFNFEYLFIDFQEKVTVFKHDAHKLNSLDWLLMFLTVMLFYHIAYRSKEKLYSILFFTQVLIQITFNYRVSQNTLHTFFMTLYLQMVRDWETETAFILTPICVALKWVVNGLWRCWGTEVMVNPN